MIILALTLCIFEINAQELYTQYIVKAFNESTYPQLLINHPEYGNTIIGSGRNQTGSYDFFVLKTDDYGEVTAIDTLERIGIFYMRRSSQFVMLDDSIALVPEQRNKVIQKVDIKNSRFDGEVQIEKKDTSSLFLYNPGIKRYKDGYVMGGYEVNEHKDFRNAIYTILDTQFYIIEEGFINLPDARGNILEVNIIQDSVLLFIGNHSKRLPNGRNKVGLFIAKKEENEEIEIIYKPEFPDTIGVVNPTETIILDNGDIILSYVLYTETNANDLFYDVWGINRMMRFNLDGEIIWDKPIGWANPSDRNKINRIIPSNDDNFIYVGQQSPNDYHYLDTIFAGGIYDENGDTIRNYAVISKFEEDGNEIWHRSYRYWGDLILGTNTFEDVVPLQDKSGYHLIGTSSKRLHNGNTTFAWLWQMTVDNYGCLVPGCHLPSSVDEEMSPSENTIRLYPNPTVDFVNILNDRKYTYRLIDNIGNIVSTFESTSYDETIVLDMRSYASGVYYLQKCKGKNCITESFIKN